MRCKPSVCTAIEELKKLKQSISAAVSEEIALAIQQYKKLLQQTSLPAAMAIPFVVYVIKKIKKLYKDHDGDVEEVRSYTYKELAKSTGRFCDSNALGWGSGGEVYKATFGNGEKMAIKKLNYLAEDKGKEKEKEFIAEILSIGCAHHKHLVKVVGFCADEYNRLTVYEYVSNQSLGYHLHGEKAPILSWSNRKKIAIGSAKGLKYLHERCHPRNVHCNIKANNILLDDSFEPKIGDFGLSRDIPYSAAHVSTEFLPYSAAHVSAKPGGAFGYLAPEVSKENNRKLTTGDVFSFGIVLLELITGKKAVIKEHQMRHNLAVWLVPCIKKVLESGKYEEIVDPKLKKEYINQKELGGMIHCAAACVYKPATDRPSMSQIVKALQGNIPLEQIWTISDNKFLYDGAPYQSPPRGSPEI